MAVDCPFFRSSMAFPTVCAPYCSADGSALLVLPLVNGFHDGSRAVLLSGWQWIAHSSARQRLSQRFARRIAQRRASYFSYFRSSTAFPTVCAPYCSADDSASLLRPLAKGFHGSHAVFLSGWQRIAPSSARQRLSQFARRFPQRIVAHCSFVRSPKAFTVCAPFSSADGSASLLHPLAKGFHGLRAVFLSRWQRIALSSACQRLSRRFARRIALRMTAHRSFIRSPKAFTVCAPFSSADGSGLLYLPLVNGFPDGLRALLLSRWQRIARSSARQHLSRFSRRFPQRMAAHCSFFRSSTSFTGCAPFSSADGSTLLVLSLVNGFQGLRAILLSG